MGHRAMRVALSAAVAATGIDHDQHDEGAHRTSAATWSIVDLTNPGIDATRLAQEIAGQGVTITSATFTGDARQGGLFSGPGVVDAIGVTDGVVMSSGIVGEVVGPNNSGGNGESFGGAGDTGLDAIVAPYDTRDAAVLKMTFVPTSPDLQINYVFASEEYQECVDTAVQRRVRVLGERRHHGNNCATVADPGGLVAGDDQHDQPPAQHADLHRQPAARAVRHPVRRFHPAADVLRDGESERPEHAQAGDRGHQLTRSWMRRCSWSRRVSRRHRRRGTRQLAPAATARHAARWRQDPGRRHDQRADRRPRRRAGRRGVGGPQRHRHAGRRQRLLDGVPER